VLTFKVNVRRQPSRWPSRAAWESHRKPRAPQRDAHSASQG
jgi:hypothetical protein